MKRRKQKSLDEIHYGPEPHAEDTRNEHACLNWYNYMSDNKSCGEWLSEWMKERGYEKEHYMGVKRLSYVPRTAAALARMQSIAVPCMFKDNLLNPQSTAFIKEHVKKCINDIKSAKSIKEDFYKTKKSKPKLSIQDRIQNKADEYAGEIEYKLDCYLDNPKKNTFDVFT